MGLSRLVFADKHSETPTVDDTNISPHLTNVDTMETKQQVYSLGHSLTGFSSDLTRGIPPNGLRGGEFKDHTIAEQ